MSAVFDLQVNRASLKSSKKESFNAVLQAESVPGKLGRQSFEVPDGQEVTAYKPVFPTSRHPQLACLLQFSTEGLCKYHLFHLTNVVLLENQASTTHSYTTYHICFPKLILRYFPPFTNREWEDCFHGQPFKLVLCLIPDPNEILTRLINSQLKSKTP